MNLAIIGTGHVGLVTGTCFAEKGHRVLCVDNDRDKIRILRKGQTPFYEPGLLGLVRKHRKNGRLLFSTSVQEAVDFADVLFIAVGTPLGDDGSADLSYVEGVSREIALNLKDYRVIVEKSTVPVQTGQRIKRLIQKYAPGKDFDMVSNPEFLQEGRAVKTTLYPDRIVVGVETKRAERIMRHLYRSFNVPFIVTDLASAELIKHSSNSFLAMKISYANALARICELAGADISLVTHGLGLDKRIGPDFLRAGIGYGGYCLPKDVAAFTHIAKQLGYNFNLLKEVQKINIDQRRWFIRKIEKHLGKIKGKKIGVWGLSFKPDTDDVRESPAVAICRKLIQDGTELQIYDPKIRKLQTPTPDLIGGKFQVRFCRTPYEATRDTDCLVILTDWAEFKRVNFAGIKKTMKNPLVIDGRNMFTPSEMSKAGFVYVSIGRK